MMKKRNEKFFNNNWKAGGKEKPRKLPREILNYSQFIRLSSADEWTKEVAEK
jgi:hypothetical protein